MASFLAFTSWFLNDEPVFLTNWKILGGFCSEEGPATADRSVVGELVGEGGGVKLLVRDRLEENFPTMSNSSESLPKVDTTRIWFDGASVGLGRLARIRSLFFTLLTMLLTILGG